MVYTDVIEQNLILPKKNLYTIWDVKQLIKIHSYSIAVFIVKCSAIYHATDWSKNVR
jgi:hypothetical protein